MNGEVCCILGVCCPPLSSRQRDALSREMMKDLGCDREYADKISGWVLRHFDLAPAGTLKDLKASLAKLIKENVAHTD